MEGFPASHCGRAAGPGIQAATGHRIFPADGTGAREVEGGIQRDGEKVCRTRADTGGTRVPTERVQAPSGRLEGKQPLPEGSRLDERQGCLLLPSVQQAFLGCQEKTSLSQLRRDLLQRLLRQHHAPAVVRKAGAGVRRVSDCSAAALHRILSGSRGASFSGRSF